MKKILLLPVTMFLLAGCATNNAPAQDEGEEQGPKQDEVAEDDISTGYGFVLGGHKYSLKTNDDDGTSETRKGRYVISNLKLVANTEFYFTNNGEMIDEKIGAKSDVTSHSVYNNWKYGNAKGKFLIGVSESNATFEFEVWKDGGYSFYSATTTAVDHGTEPTEGAVTMLTYTITDCPDWTNKNHVKVFAWSWGGESADSEGKWRPCTLDPVEFKEGTKVTATFMAPDDSTGLLLVRCHEDSVAPDYKLQDAASLNTPGRIYNKTDNIEVVAGTTEYRCPQFTSYFCD